MGVTRQSPKTLPAALVASSFMEWLSRVGYVAHGAIYILSDYSPPRLHGALEESWPTHPAR